MMRNIFALICCAFILAPSTARATDYYANPFTSVTQANGHAGTALDPFMSWSDIRGHLGPGNRVLLNPGLYTVLAYITKSGSAGGGYETLQCNTSLPTSPGSDGRCVIDVSKDPVANTGKFSMELNFLNADYTQQYVSYIKLINLEIDNGYTGGDGLATAIQWDTDEHQTNLYGTSPTYIHHHVVLDHLTSRNDNCFALQIQDFDYATISNSAAYHVGATCTSQSASGIETLDAVNTDFAPGPHNFYYNNVVYDVRYGTGLLSDGNGIILDDYQHVINMTTVPAFASTTMVYNNVVFNNDGKCIHVFKSNNAVIAHNTCIDNEQTHKGGNIYGEIDVSHGKNVQIYNNIIVASYGNPYFYASDGTGAWEDGNLVYGTTPGVNIDATFLNNAWGADNITGNPNLPYSPASPPATIAGGIAALTPPAGSPALDAAICYWTGLTSADGMTSSDILGNLRNLAGCSPISSAIDIGAIAVNHL